MSHLYKLRWVLGLAVLALVGVGAVLVIGDEDPVVKCLRTSLGGGANVSFEAEIVKAGKFKIESASSNDPGYQLVSEQTKLSAIQVCRDAYRKDAAPGQVVAGPSALQLASAPVMVTVKRAGAGGEIPVNGATVYFETSGQRAKCDTRDTGQCELVVTDVVPQAELSVAVKFEGKTTSKTVSVMSLIRDGMVLNPADNSPQLTVSALDCVTNRSLENFSVSVDSADGVQVWKQECGSAPPVRPADCRKAFVQDGEAVFFYAGSKPKTLDVTLTLASGEQEPYAIQTSDTSAIRLTYPKTCAAVGTATSALRPDNQRDEQACRSLQNLMRRAFHESFNLEVTLAGGKASCRGGGSTSCPASFPDKEKACGSDRFTLAASPL